MKLGRRQFLHQAASAAALSAIPRIASAQTYPARPLHLIVGYGAGSGPDIRAPDRPMVIAASRPTMHY